jgi:hypothetical protein
MSDQCTQKFIPDPHGPDECREDIVESCRGNLLPRILRVLGAGIIFSCASIFLFQRWGVGNDIQRYLLLLAFTAVLTAGGFFCGLKLKESKGARTLLALTLAVTPVNFAVLGALIYSQFSVGGTGRMPTFATWVAPTPESAIMIAVAGAAALAPLCYISFLTMGRYRARSLSACFFLGNLALLVPTRQPDPVGILMVLSVIGLTWCEFRFFRSEITLKTWEGRFARMLMWAPPLLLVGRTGYFYYRSELFSGCTLAAAALLGFIFLPSLTRQLHVQKVLQGMSAVAGIASWLLFADVISRTLSLGSQWVLPLCTLPVAALLFSISFHAIGGGAVYRRSAALIALLGMTANLFLYPGLLASFICLATAVLILVYGFVVEQRFIFFSGLAGVVVGLAYHLKFALSFYSLVNWGSMAITGVAIVILASIVERQQGRMKDKIQLYRKRFQSWSN